MQFICPTVLKYLPCFPICWSTSCPLPKHNLLTSPLTNFMMQLCSFNTNFYNTRKIVAIWSYVLQGLLYQLVYFLNMIQSVLWYNVTEDIINTEFFHLEVELRRSSLYSTGVRIKIMYWTLAYVDMFGDFVVSVVVTDWFGVQCK